MPRKVFISVLGFSLYRECFYVKDNFKSSSVRFIQEATLDYLCQTETWTSTDCAYILLTHGAEQANWMDDGHKDYNTGEIIKSEGLHSRLQNKNFPFEVCTISNLPDGNTEDEIWDIFEKVFNTLKEGDELYFDLTHGFRYLPMLVMVLINYSKFLKNTKVRSITYGNYESRNKTTNEAPIIDLLPLSSLQDWTFAAGQFINSGSVERLAQLSNDKLRPVLRESKGTNENATNLKRFILSLENTVEDMQTCRGINIIESTNISTLRKTSEQLQTTFIKPLNPIFDKIKDNFRDFSDTPDVWNGFLAAKWCLENNLYQQSITILQENVVTFICQNNQIDSKDKQMRELVNKAFNILEYKREESEWAFSSLLSEESKDNQKDIIRQLLTDDYLIKLTPIFARCTNIRNDLNHSGIVANPCKTSKLKEGVKACISEVHEIIAKQF